MKHPVHKRALRMGMGLLALSLIAPGGALAQAQGQVTGRVVDAQTGRPLSGAQIFIPGTQRGGSRTSPVGT